MMPILIKIQKICQQIKTSLSFWILLTLINMFVLFFLARIGHGNLMFQFFMVGYCGYHAISLLKSSNNL